MQKVTVVTCFIGESNAPSIGVLAGHVPPDDVPVSGIMNTPGTQVGILHTYVGEKSTSNSEKIEVQELQMALANWKEHGEFRFE